jgi:mono/diheme cytochrome c family protein
VRAGTFLKVGRLLGLTVAAAALTGCEPDPYPETLTYGVRRDLLIEQRPIAENLPHADPLGRFEQSVDAIRNMQGEKGGAAVFDPNDMNGQEREELEKILTDLFGTPARPTVNVDEPGEYKELLKDLDPETLARGSKLYRRHCLHCHGVAGDGRGPTATWVNPHPRDYRRGYFKFLSSGSPSGDLVVSSAKSKPSRDDLLRTLREGVEGTSMPSFKLLSADELNDMVSYVIHLSMRGSVEYDVLRSLLSVPADKRGESHVKGLREEAVSRLSGVAEQWQNESKPVEVVKYPYAFEALRTPTDPKLAEEREGSIRRGFQHFAGAGACAKCHLDFGRQPGFRYDHWGTLVRPANLTQGVYRGGRRPVDLYYRVALGIFPSDMPGAGDALRRSPEKIWDLVNFLQALPYPEMLPSDIKELVYGRQRQWTAPE